MNAPLYTLDILRLAASLEEPRTLARVDGHGEARSQTCGSSVATDVELGPDGTIGHISQRVSACAFGQASAALVGAHAAGRTRAEIAAALAELSDWLAGRRDDPGTWPGLDALRPALGRTSRHGAILLPFRALDAAIQGSTR